MKTNLQRIQVLISDTGRTNNAAAMQVVVDFMAQYGEEILTLLEETTDGGLDIWAKFSAAGGSIIVMHHNLSNLK